MKDRVIFHAFDKLLKTLFIHEGFLLNAPQNKRNRKAGQQKHERDSEKQKNRMLIELDVAEHRAVN